MNLGRVGIAIAARTSSSRLPGKALLELNGIPMITFLLHRLHGTKMGDVVLATTSSAADDRLVDIVRAVGVPVFRGAEDDVVGRYVAVARQYGFDTVARVTADCPFVDAEMLDRCIANSAKLDRFDLATTKGEFPIGLDVEIYEAGRMAELDRGGKLSAEDREHLTLYYYRHRDELLVRGLTPPSNWRRTERHFTVDNICDYEFAKQISAKFGRTNFSIPELLDATT